MSIQERIDAVKAVNASTFPGHDPFSDWQAWVRESARRLDEAERDHHREAMEHLRRFTA